MHKTWLNPQNRRNVCSLQGFDGLVQPQVAFLGPSGRHAVTGFPRAVRRDVWALGDPALAGHGRHTAGPGSRSRGIGEDQNHHGVRVVSGWVQELCPSSVQSGQTMLPRRRDRAKDDGDVDPT